MNDLWHALILIGLLMAFFAGIGNWRFGSSRQDFSSFMAAMGTEFQVCMAVVNSDAVTTSVPALFDLVNAQGLTGTGCR